MTQPRQRDDSLRVVHLATHDGRGGAARATRRLHSGLLGQGVQSRVLVRERFSDDPGIVALADGAGSERRRARGRALADALVAQGPVRIPRGRFSDDRTELGADLVPGIPDAHVYNLHWVGGFVDWAAVLPALSARAPLVWTLSDMNPLTGGCHYDHGCGRYREACGACPQLGSSDPGDRTAVILRRKLETLGRLRPGSLRVVAASHWLADRVRESRMGDRVAIEVIPRAVDVGTFRPRDREPARRSFGLGPAERVALFVSTHLTNPRKGIEYALEAARVARGVPGLRLVCVGFGPVPEVADDLPITWVEHIASDARMADLMSAADVLLAPSLQEAFGLTFLEALACGTPVVAFDTGGAADLVKPGVHGYVVPVGDGRAMGKALAGLLGDETARARMAEACRALVLEGYGLDHQAGRYRELYNSLLRDASSATG
jgi:glycosyltransferase involved in cell wall biosynthesis